MILTSNNSDEAIVAYLMSPKCKGMDFFDPATGKVFEASPCETCRTMTAHANEVTIERVSDRLNRALQQYFKVLPFVECIGYDDDGAEICEKCD